ncbi:hypothetical protein BCS42_05365 [Crenothrix sp. D3]|nr:hypothetical protein BCS42_05365 [Crenothrix sp. D3]
MNAINQNKTPEINLDNNFDALCQGFGGGSVYGLEYIIEDFFQNKTVKNPVPVRDTVDWFGLNT